VRGLWGESGLCACVSLQLWCQPSVLHLGVGGWLSDLPTNAASVCPCVGLHQLAAIPTDRLARCGFGRRSDLEERSKRRFSHHNLFNDAPQVVGVAIPACSLSPLLLYIPGQSSPPPISIALFRCLGGVPSRDASHVSTTVLLPVQTRCGKLVGVCSPKHVVLPEALVLDMLDVCDRW
jgi:hypothetical protein